MPVILPRPWRKNCVPYYHDLVTQKSWEELLRLKRTVKFVLIGGWAVYLYTKALKSKDIDILVDFDELPVLQKNYRLVKNERLKKYEAVREEVQIDIYLPHYSRLGIEVSVLQKEAHSFEGFSVLDASYLTALKIHTLAERARSPKGEKDFIDILSLVNSAQVNLTDVKAIMETHSLAPALAVFQSLLEEHREIPEIPLTQHAYAKIKKKIKAGLGKEN